MSDHERYEHLLMKAVDGVIDPREQRELDAHLATCAICVEDLAGFRSIKEATDAMTQRILSHARIAPPRETGMERVTVSASLLAILAGALLLIGFAGYTLALDPAVPPVVKIGAGLSALGGAGLLAYVLRRRWHARGGRDPYEEIDQ